MLERYIERYRLDLQPGAELGGNKPPEIKAVQGPPDDQAFVASSFYSVAFSASGETLAVDNGINDFTSEDELVGIAKKTLKKGKSSGKINNLMYKIERQNGYTLVAFINVAVTSENMNILLRQIFITGALAVIVIFFIAVFLAHRIVKPLEESDKRQKQFVSDAGHELKTPVAVINTNTELLSRQIGENEWLSNIQYETERMGTLVTQLLDLSHAENAEIKTEKIDLGRLVAGEALPFESVAFEAGFEICSEIADNIYVEGNRTQLSQLVSILLDNAIRHSDGGKEIGLTLKREHKAAVLSVINNGKEIPPEIREKLFERFYRVDEVRNSEGKHYGLGLAIAKAIADAHHGSIHSNCKDGKVIFTVKLPIKN
ncbi:MAG: HAMP domain-containing histidine kinase [Clostridia bacterium]|nr:HAMP domain-containing histidine kinase [Clostridia bacterium]